MFKFNFAALLALAAVFFQVVAAVDQLQVGVLKRIPEDKCTRKASKGNQVEVHYTGSLDDGSVFDSSLERGQPIAFTLGAGQVIQGWDLGVLGMCIGEKRKLSIPPHLAYGKRGAGGVIPPDASLTFTVELVGVDGYYGEENNDEEADVKDEL